MNRNTAFSIGWPFQAQLSIIYNALYKFIGNYFVIVVEMTKINIPKIFLYLFVVFFLDFTLLKWWFLHSELIISIVTNFHATETMNKAKVSPKFEIRLLNSKSRVDFHDGKGCRVFIYNLLFIRSFINSVFS